MPDLVIFDCDGVLVDSEVISNEVLARMLTREGVPTTLAEARRACQGRLLTDVRDRAQAKLGRPFPPDWIAEYEDERDEAFRRELTPVQGAAEAVQRVKAAGLKVCVASQGQLAKTRLTLGLTGLRDLFPPGALFSAYDVPRPKPDPRALSTRCRDDGRSAVGLRGHRGHHVRSHGCRCRRDASDRLRGRQRRARASQRRRRDHPLPGRYPGTLGPAPSVNHWHGVWSRR